MNYTKEVVEEAVKNSHTYCDVLRFLNIKIHGSSCRYIKTVIIKFNKEV